MKIYAYSPYSFNHISLSQIIHSRFKRHVTHWLAVVLLMFAGTVYADHDDAHEIQNLKGGLGALEQRVWDCEHGVGGACPGTPGADGADGATGPEGPQGEQGSQGAPGADGADGAPGVAGPAGADGLDGFDGTNGADGTQGPAGLSCWDTNGNGVADPEEDTTANGVVDTLDCLTALGLSDLLNRLDVLEGRSFRQDLDRDSVSPAGGDCDDANPLVGGEHIVLGTFREEVPGDGLDNDCDGLVDNASTDFDSDGDTVSDLDEAIYGCNPLKSDTDGDSLSEHQIYTVISETCNDVTTCTGIFNTDCTTRRICEPIYGNVLVPAVSLFDGQEIALGTSCSLADTDGDGVNDGREIRNGTDPLVPN